LQLHKNDITIKYKIKYMNSPSEQIRPDLSLEIAMDQVLTPKQQQDY
jgi:hypothetical protein